VNLVSDVESNLASVPLTLQSLGNAQEGLPETAPKRAAGARSNAWLAALGLLVIALEVTLFTRRKRTTATSERSG
jgi:LPXTG-motif cell wall-anchored protein